MFSNGFNDQIKWILIIKKFTNVKGMQYEVIWTAIIPKSTLTTGCLEA